MKNLTELNHIEQVAINGGTEAPTFAYRVGQGIRFLGLSSIGGSFGSSFDYAWNNTFGIG
jgi:hypothetical protein